MNEPRIIPDRETYMRLAREYSVIPVSAELPADWWTPVTAFSRLVGDRPNGFLLESVEGGERVGRYSFLGREPFLVVRGRDGRVTWRGEAAAALGPAPEDPRRALDALFRHFRAPAHEHLPPFTGGAVGYFGYDTVRWVETLPDLGRRPVPEDELILLCLRDVAAFDHVSRRLVLISNGLAEDGEAGYDAAAAHVRDMIADLHRPFAPPRPGRDEAPPPVEPASNLTRAGYTEAVRLAKEHIAAGDIFQVVLSQRFRVPSPSRDLALYRSLRAVNPSPYMFLLRLEGWSAVGSSPEPLVTVTGRELRYRPIAGTVPRTGDEAADADAAERLRADPKERAEHVMLVDLGRNDLGRCAVPGSVAVNELMVVERYSHVMHLVSGLSATLRPELTPLDALFACFPAGTVSGAPKIRAMEIIEELEPDRRGLYAGAVGYVDFSGNLDTCIALRTMIVRGGEVIVQAGAGIVADSDPDREYEETRHKARALLEAVRRADRE